MLTSRCRSTHVFTQREVPSTLGTLWSDRSLGAIESLGTYCTLGSVESSESCWTYRALGTVYTRRTDWAWKFADILHLERRYKLKSLSTLYVLSSCTYITNVAQEMRTISGRKKLHYCVLFSWQLACITASIQLVENSKDMLFILFCSDNLGHGYLMPRGRSLVTLKVRRDRLKPKCVTQSMQLFMEKSFVSGIVTGDAPISYGNTFFPCLFSNIPRSICKS